jgi:modification methylase
MMHYIINIGDSRKVDTVQDNSIHFALTSPPYGDAVNYGNDSDLHIGNYELKEYIPQIEPIYKEVFRMLEPGRCFAVNITDLVTKAKEDDRTQIVEYENATVDLLKKIGFLYQTRIIWTKGMSKTIGHLGSIPYPGAPYIIIDSEMIFIMRKPGSAEYRYTSEEKALSKIPATMISECTTNVWKIRPETQLTWHPAPYPEELASRLIKMYTYVGEIVYDPFLGSGTTMLAAKNCGRSCIGTELGYKVQDESLNKTWLEALKGRVGWGTNAYGEQVIWKINDLKNGSSVEDIVKEGNPNMFEDQKKAKSLFSFEQNVT